MKGEKRIGQAGGFLLDDPKNFVENRNGPASRDGVAGLQFEEEIIVRAVPRFVDDQFLDLLADFQIPETQQVLFQFEHLAPGRVTGPVVRHELLVPGQGDRRLGALDDRSNLFPDKDGVVFPVQPVVAEHPFEFPKPDFLFLVVSPAVGLQDICQEVAEDIEIRSRGLQFPVVRVLGEAVVDLLGEPLEERAVGQEDAPLIDKLSSQEIVYGDRRFPASSGSGKKKRRVPEQNLFLFRGEEEEKVNGVCFG